MKPDPEKESRFAWLEIDLSSLACNIELIRSCRARPSAKIMAVVKADAYGHGAAEISRHALKSGACALGVAFAEEGMLIRNEGIDAPIYILGECPAAAAEYAIENNLVLTVNSITSVKTYYFHLSSMFIKSFISYKSGVFCFLSCMLLHSLWYPEYLLYFPPKSAFGPIPLSILPRLRTGYLSVYKYQLYQS